MSDQPEDKKEAWDAGWDLVTSHDDPEAEEDAVAGALAGLASGHDLEDHDSRVHLALFFINSMAHVMTFPEPSEADPDPLGTPEKEAAWGKRKTALAEHLANAFAQWDAHDRAGHCAECGESLQLEAEPAAKSGSPKAN